MKDVIDDLNQVVANLDGVAKTFNENPYPLANTLRSIAARADDHYWQAQDFRQAVATLARELEVEANSTMRQPEGDVFRDLAKRLSAVVFRRAYRDAHPEPLAAHNEAAKNKEDEQ